MKNSQVDSGSRAPSPSRAPFEPRPSTCKDIGRSINSYLPMLVNSSKNDNTNENQDIFKSGPANLESGRLSAQADVDANHPTSFKPDESDMTTENIPQETDGPAIVVNHPLADTNSLPDEPSTMESTTNSFQFSQFDCSDFDTTTGHFTQDVTEFVSPFSEPSEISPQLFDDLQLQMHSPFVARYAHFDGNFSGPTDPHARLIAALPSRIIAQIASDSFMDYELVSDYFLTFRAFMDSQILLKMLFARLEWSLDKKSADGRIARIRTFAAMRHWVLNYFADDFLHEKDGWVLRNEFCNNLNRLYRKIKIRMSRVNLQEPETRRGNMKARPAAVASDLKVLIDLKRCWVGRCDAFCNSTDDLGIDDSGFSYNASDGFDADRDIEPGLAPHDDGGENLIQGNVEVNPRRLSRYTDVRFSHYGAIRPTDSTTLPVTASSTSAASINMTLEADDQPAANAFYHQKQRFSHVKTNSQSSTVSANSVASKRRLEAKRKQYRTTSDSVRTEIPIVRRQSSVINKQRPNSHNDIEAIKRQQLSKHNITFSVLKNDGDGAGAMKDEHTRPMEPLSVAQDTRLEVPILQIEPQSASVSAPLQNLIRGTLFTPVEGIIHVLGDIPSAQVSCNEPEHGGSHSPQYHLCSIRSHHEDCRRPVIGAWGLKGGDMTSTITGLMSRDDVSVVTSDTPRTPIKRFEHHDIFRLRSPMQSPERNRSHAGDTPKRSITLPLNTSPTDSPPYSHPPRGETYSNAEDEKVNYIQSSGQGVKHIMGTLRRAFGDRKHSNQDDQTLYWNGHDNRSSNGSAQGKSARGRHPRGETFAGRFHLKKAAHTHSFSGGSNPSQTRSSFDRSRNWEGMTSRNKSTSIDRSRSPTSHLNTSYAPSEPNSSALNNRYPTVGIPKTRKDADTCDHAALSPPRTQISPPGEKPHIHFNPSQEDKASSHEHKGSLNTEGKGGALIMQWLNKNKEARVDLLAESAAENYMDRFSGAVNEENQKRSSVATIFTPDVTTHSVQIRVARANERTSDCISAEVKKAMTKLAASSDPEPQHAPPRQSSPCSLGSPISRSRRPVFSQGQETSQLQPSRTLSGDYSVVSSAAGTGFREPNGQPTSERTLYAGLGFGLDLASRIPRRPSANGKVIESPPSSEHHSTSKSAFNRLPPYNCSSPVPYPGPDLTTVESAPSSGRNSSDTRGNAVRYSLIQTSDRISLDPRSLGDSDANSIEMRGGNMERSVTRTTQGTQISQSTDHSQTRPLSKSGQPTERPGVVARSMKSWGNRLRKYASYQSGMSKLNFRRHHEHEHERVDDANIQRQGEGHRGRSLWGRNKYLLHHHHHDANNTPGKVLNHHPLNISSFDVHGKIDEHDREDTTSPIPLLTLPSSSLRLSLPSPFLFENIEDSQQPVDHDQSPQKIHHSPGSDIGSTTGTYGSVPLRIDTATSASVESPYLAPDFTWQRFELVNSLSGSQANEDVCSGGGQKTPDAEPAARPHSDISRSSEDSIVSTNEGPVSKEATFAQAAVASESPFDDYDCEHNQDINESEEIWESPSVNTSPSKPTIFPRYSLHVSDSQDRDVGKITCDDNEANDSHFFRRSVNSDLGLKTTIPVSPDSDGQRSDDLLSSNDSELSYHSAQQDTNALNDAHSQETPEDGNVPKVHANDAGPSSLGPESVSPLKGQSKEVFHHTEPQDCSLAGDVSSSLRQPVSRTPSNRAEKAESQANIPDTLASPHPPSTHEERHEKAPGSQQELAPAADDDSVPQSEKHAPSSKYQHAPFILAYSSRVLAEQMTIIEVAALAEIDWRDLVDMNWSNDQTALDWSVYLASEERRGIDVVIARFNLMVKWIVSEIVLTHDISERAHAISKFIHVAIHARRMRNFSTMVQVTIALSSVDCASLKSTWALVDPDSKQAFEDMESLVQPLRNFKDLRMEMESQGLHEGCVPFVGLYVQDLTYNAQKPATIHIEGGVQPLINLERYRTAASIIKSLLRLIDASTRYGLTPINGVIERCLWISCLKDEDIRHLSKSLEL